MKKVLLVVYRFPPMGGVGSRRWVKFCKYLDMLGCELHVITVKYPWQDKVNWQHDLSNVKNLHVTRLSSAYPIALLRPSSEQTFWQKNTYIVRRCIAEIKARINHSIDYASSWSRTVVDFSADYIKQHQIKNIIFSGPPSSLHLTAALLKSQLPLLNYIQDYRDPWNNDLDYYLKRIWSLSHKADMLVWEKMGLECANKIVVVSEQMKSEIISLFGIESEKVVVIRNGFDPDDFVGLRSKSKKNNNSINFVYAGTLGEGENSRMGGLKRILAVAESFPENIRSRFIFTIYSDKPFNYYSSSGSKFLREQIRFFSMVSPLSLVEKLSEADVCLSINRVEDAHAMGTKVYDYMGLGKAIFHLGGGELGSILDDKKQFVSGFDNEHVRKSLEAIVLSADNAGLTQSSDHYSEFAISSLAYKYAQLFVE